MSKKICSFQLHSEINFQNCCKCVFVCLCVCCTTVVNESHESSNIECIDGHSLYFIYMANDRVTIILFLLCVSPSSRTEIQTQILFYFNINIEFHKITRCRFQLGIFQIFDYLLRKKNGEYRNWNRDHFRSSN